MCILLLLIYLFFLILFIICVFCSVTVILLRCGSFYHENKFLVCVNIPGNKAHSDSDSDSSIIKGKSPVIAFLHLYEYAAIRAGAPWRSTQESHFETSR